MADANPSAQILRFPTADMPPVVNPPPAPDFAKDRMATADAALPGDAHQAELFKAAELFRTRLEEVANRAMHIDRLFYFHGEPNDLEKTQVFLDTARELVLVIGAIADSGAGEVMKGGVDAWFLSPLYNGRAEEASRLNQ